MVLSSARTLSAAEAIGWAGVGSTYICGQEICSTSAKGPKPCHAREPLQATAKLGWAYKSLGCGSQISDNLGFSQ